MDNKTIYILWNNSCLWGLMALRAIRTFGLDCRLVKSYEITQGVLLGKPPQKVLLLAPGGAARLKAQALGEHGRNAIRHWLYQGGQYLGICGGAGFALKADKGPDSLSICPWRRAAYAEHYFHLMSGNVWASLQSSKSLKLPIWWPGRFEEKNTDGIRVLARYLLPTCELYLGDETIFSQKHKTCMAAQDFPHSQPLVISGRYGKGSYLLSYAHLETPASYPANKWLAELLEEQFGFSVKNFYLPQWWTMAEKPANSIELIQQNCMDMSLYMHTAHASMTALMHLGQETGMFFKRLPWLVGWKSGTPGIVCNHLLAGLAYLAQNVPSSTGLPAWQNSKNLFTTLYPEFCRRAVNFMFDWHKLGKTEEKVLLKEQYEIFGHPMQGGGLIQKLLDIVYEFIYLCDNAQKMAD